MKKIISLQLDESIIEELKLICKQQDRSMSSLCRMAIINFIEKSRNTED